MKNEKPLITVVTLTYKKFEYIYETIDSVLSQTYENIEYIIADDGTEKFPYSELYNYINNNKKKNIKYFSILTKDKNEGTVKNINRAYKKAKGEILIPLSGDDSFYDMNVVERIVNIFLKRNCDLLVTRRCLILEDKKLLSPTDFEIKRIDKLKTNTDQNKAFITSNFYNMASGSALYIKKEYLKENGFFDESYILWEDGPFLTKYTSNKKIDYDYSLISIRYHMGGVSNSGENPLMRKDRIYYNENDRILYAKHYDFFIKRHVKYISQRYICRNNIEKIIVYIKFFDIILYKIIKKIFEN